MRDCSRGWKQVRVGALAAAADATAQLVQLREAEQVGAVDDERVDRRDVEPALDDRGADQHVVLAFPEVEHHPLETALVHLPVRDADARLGDELAQLLAHEVDVLHPVVDEEHLTLTQQLPPDRLGRGPVVELAHVGEDGLAVLGRRVHEREVADPGERHLEGARDRCRREREHVDVGAELLDELLVLDAETLLLVDDEQAEVLEPHVARQEAVGRRSPRRPTRRRRRRPRRPAPWRSGTATAPRRAPGSSRSARGTSGRAGWRAAWSGPGSRPACRPARP